MLRITTGLTKLSLNTNPISANLQIVRWKRKPRWLPTAKSKMFRVPARPVIPTDEAEELKRLNNNYRNHMKSIKRFVFTRLMMQLKSEDSRNTAKAMFEDLERCDKINAEWNATVGKDRERFFEEQLRKDVELAKQRLEFQQFKQAVRLEEAENMVREQKEQSKNFITPDNIDAAIERALANVTDHNFAIDLDGNKYYGRETVPNKEEKEKSKASVKQ